MVALLAELKRRKIFPVAAVYGVVAWIVAQAVTLVEEPLALPSWFDTAIIVLLIAGFPVALVLAWIFDVTPTSPQKAVPAAPATAGGAARLVAAPKLHQTIKFCTTPDGVRLAYATVGGGPALVKTANWFSHLELDWESPIYGHMLRDFANEFRLTVYDQRGNGLSDWDAKDISLQGFLTDLETVVDAAGVERFALMGFSQGCLPAIASAVEHPERLTHLVLFGGFASNFRDPAQTEAIATLIEQGWGQNNPAFRQMFTSALIVKATKEESDWLNEMQLKSTSPSVAARIFRAIHAMDVTMLAPKITVPTLVLHARDEGGVPFEIGRRMAALIPGARLVGLDTENHMLLERDPAYARFKEEVFAFLR
jgi:pimeloyl-ACP methyl ester carboxylesterase